MLPTTQLWSITAWILLKMTNLQVLPQYFSSLTHDLAQRSELATQGLLSLGSEPLRQHLSNMLLSKNSKHGALLSDPVFEPTFGWQTSSETMGGLSGNLLNSKLVKIMSNPPESLKEDYEFPLSRHPFTHQVKAWKILGESKPKSLVVTSGTGSGKTECFLVPILNDLSNQLDQATKPLQGVQALFIYPLNALINSQQSRLDAWTDGFEGKIRHCLYTGALEKEVKKNQREFQGQVLDRTELRESAPPLLVTNATMLEYMLVRKEDESILSQSQGKLKWIVLDEAHSYVGSQAAEMALLLRRVMLAFNVKPENVRFIATSATFGADDETILSLKRFLADMGGISPDQVEVVQGHRSIPHLNSKDNGSLTLQQIRSIEPDFEVSEARFNELLAHPLANKIRNAFITEQGTTVRTLTEVHQVIDATFSLDELMLWLDLLTGTKPDAGKQAFLPLRMHLFHNVIPTIRACINQECQFKDGTPLMSDQWTYGNVYTFERTHCSCGSLLLPLVSCNECNEHFLIGKKQNEILRDSSFDVDDEFTLDGDEDETDSEIIPTITGSSQLLVVNKGRSLHLESPIDDPWLNRESSKLQFEYKIESDIQIQTYNVENTCPCCLSKAETNKLFRHARIGAPFTLSTAISTTLEYCPKDKQNLGKPFEGRKMISFTDSRQGTARIAVKIQQDSERARIRGLIYHKLLIDQSHLKSALSDAEAEHLKTLSEFRDEGYPLKNSQLETLSELEKKALSKPEAIISWNDLALHLSKSIDISHNIISYYKNIAPDIFNNHQGSLALAQVLLAREFAIRPKRANTLETMGFVQVVYPKLIDIKETPLQWPSDLISWKRYLTTLLNFYLRGGNYTDLRSEWRSSIGLRFSIIQLASPRLDIKNSPYVHVWPTIKGGSTRSRPITLLTKAFGFDIKNQKDTIDLLLIAAWDQLTQNKILEKVGDYFHLPLANCSFKLMSEAYICPISRKFLAEPFENISPFSPRSEGNKAVSVGEFIQISHPELPIDPPDLIVKTAREWVNSNDYVKKLKQLGMWSDLHERIIEGGNYFRAAEHSAQQSKDTLDRYVTDFKNGKINLLSCSTTMEMGVDIGGISVVAMNNVPPHPANYLQRAGRAGRRQEGRSLALTVCKNTPHDQAVFENPKWPFTTAMSVPRVSLQSKELVQRHINSFLLSFWMKEEMQLSKLTTIFTGTFFLSETQFSLATLFIQWLKVQKANLDENLAQAILSIIKNSVLETTTLGSLLHETISKLESIQEEWISTYAVINSQMELFGKDRNAAFKAIKVQMDRYVGAYLLSELANTKFLPGYSFPTDVVCFDNRTLDSVRAESSNDREDNRARYRQLASRDRVTALREYAPGAELVMDGLVYRSSGVTLNWKSPSSEQHQKEAQLFKFAWYCKKCGCNGNCLVNRPESCEECGTLLASENIKRYLVPAGFAVDFTDSKAHNDITQPNYIPVKKPWISVNQVEWVKLANPILGLHRSSNHAQIFHYSAGQNGTGYALCLECGRAEPMLADKDDQAKKNEEYLPYIFRKEHKKLRGGKTGTHDKCSGSYDSWKIQTNVFLGHDAITDVLEVMLVNPKTQQWLEDDHAAFSISVALRDAIADQLGVQSDELGTSNKLINHQGKSACLIQVFDLRSGGYASQASNLVNTRSLWQSVYNTLNCTCNSACQKCLISFDTRFDVDRLNRHSALEWINPQWLDALTLPIENQVFGETTCAESLPFLSAVDRDLNLGIYNEIIFHLQGSADQWDLSNAHLLKSKILEAQNRKLNVRLQLNTNPAELDELDLRRLKAYSVDAQVEYVATSELKNGFVPIVSLNGNNLIKTWASESIELGIPNQDWGSNVSLFSIVSGINLDFINGTVIDFTKMETPLVKALEIDIRNQLDGSLQKFGERFWDLLLKRDPRLQTLFEKDSLKSIYYSDRYVKSPLAMALVVQIFHQLQFRNDLDSSIVYEFYGRQFTSEPHYNPRLLHNDWLSSNTRDYVFEEALIYCGLNANILSKEKLSHPRSLQLNFISGEIVRIRLDQGFGYWKSSDYRFTFNFREGEKYQAESLVNVKIDISGDKDGENPIFISHLTAK